MCLLEVLSLNRFSNEWNIARIILESLAVSSFILFSIVDGRECLYQMFSHLSRLYTNSINSDKRNMQQNERWFYWNNLPERIPADIASLTDEERRAFLDEWNRAVWTRNVQPDEMKLINIKDMPAIFLQNVPPWIMDRVKEAADQYVNGQWTSCISLCGTITEYLSIRLLQSHFRSKGVELSGFIRRLGLYDRLQALRDMGILSDEEWKKLDPVRKVRNDYVHLDKADEPGTNIKADCLTALRDLIEFLNGHAIS